MQRTYMYTKGLSLYLVDQHDISIIFPVLQQLPCMWEARACQPLVLVDIHTYGCVSMRLVTITLATTS